MDNLFSGRARLSVAISRIPAPYRLEFLKPMVAAALAAHYPLRIVDSYLVIDVEDWMDYLHLIYPCFVEASRHSWYPHPCNGVHVHVFMTAGRHYETDIYVPKMGGGIAYVSLA